MANIIAIVGRPNVGKSTLFNRLTESREAIMHDTSGVTRDRHYGTGEWNGKPFTLIDTGGYVRNSDDIYQSAIREQVEMAISEADILMFVVDIHEGIHPLDEEFAHVLRKSNKPVYIIANKADNFDRQHLAGEFYGIGIDADVYPVSAINGSGTGELLDKLAEHLEMPDEEKPELPRIAVVGRPNVGKSSLVNLLTNQNRSIVTDAAGTTRDAVDAHFKGFGKEFILTDTAGIRKKAKVKENVEFYSVMRSIRAIEDSDVCLLMVDATQGIESQDVAIMHLAHSNHKGLVIMLNKWDLLEKETNTMMQMERQIRERLTSFPYAPIIFGSVTEKQRVQKVLDLILEVYENKHKRVPTSKLNDKLLPIIERTPPPAQRGKHIKIKYITQLPAQAPVFAFFCNHPKHIKEPYKRFIEKNIRQHFGFEGVPIRIFFREK